MCGHVRSSSVLLQAGSIGWPSLAALAEQKWHFRHRAEFEFEVSNAQLNSSEHLTGLDSIGFQDNMNVNLLSTKQAH